MLPRSVRSAVWVLLVVLARTARVQGAEKDVGTRDGWQFVENGETVTIVQKGGKEWISDRRDGRRLVYDELDRTDDYVELRNRSSKLLLRVHADRGFWRREADADWTAWCRGRWVAGDEVPAVSAAPPREHQVRLAYFVPSDRRPVSNYEEKMRVVMAFVTALVRSDLQAKGYKTDGVSLESEGGKAVVHLLRGAHPAAHYNTAPEYDIAEQWRRLVPEISASMGDRHRQVIVVLAETYDDGPARFLWPGAIARGAYYSADGGMAVYSAHILRDEFCAVTVEGQRPLFFDRTPIVGRTALGHGPDSPRCEFVEDGFGAVAHELGHALGLMHDLRQDQVYIMANGFRNLRWNLAATGPGSRRAGFSPENARLLMSSRYVAKDLELSDNEPPTLQLQFGRSGKPAKLLVQAADESGLRAFTLVDKVQGSIIAGRDLRGKNVRFEQPLPVNVLRTGSMELEGFVTDTGGNRASSTQHFPSVPPAQ